MLTYTNDPASTGFAIAERNVLPEDYHNRQSPFVTKIIMRAWFADLSSAEAWMIEKADAGNTMMDYRIIDQATRQIVAWRGIIYQVDPIGARGQGENAVTLAEWIA